MNQYDKLLNILRTETSGKKTWHNKEHSSVDKLTQKKAVQQAKLLHNKKINRYMHQLAANL